MSATVFYFSGTGNSYAIARGISSALQGRLVPIAACITKDDITVDTDSIGIVFPVYYADVPNIVRLFLQKLKELDSKYIFAVCSYGGGLGYSIKTARDLIRKNGGELSAAYGVHMPQNAFRKPWEKAPELYAKMDAVTDKICRQTKEKAKDLRASKRAVDILLAPIAPILKSLSRNYMIKTVNGSKDDSDMSLIYRLDCVFSANEKCSGCGVCARVCPVKNIAMENARPVWTHHCENCLACYNFCPRKAISGIAQKDFYYLKPEYTPGLAEGQSGR